MTVCFERFEECIDKHVLVYNTFFKSFKTNGHHNLQIYDILLPTLPTEQDLGGSSIC